MVINGKNYLLLEKRGCNFTPGDKETEKSDCENYRIGAYYERIKAENGRDYILEFTGWNKWQYRKTNKRTGKPLKKPVTEIIHENALHVDTEFENDRGCWRDCALEKTVYNSDLAFTLADILTFTNSISVEKYDGIKFIHAFENIPVEYGKDFTPAQLIREYCEQHKITMEQTYYFENVVKLYTGYYKYLCYDIKPGNGCELVTIYLEEYKLQHIGNRIA